MQPPIHAAAHDWFGRRTFLGGTDDLQELTAVKRAAGASVSVCLPALNERSTIGPICERTSRLADIGVIDELVVVDSGSTDGTADLAAAAGATVYRVSEILPALPALPGKGEALWRSLAIVQGDIVVFLDADLRNFDEGFVTRLLEPLLRDRGIALVKGFYDRHLPSDPGLGGGRVTELVARPLLNLFYPELTGIVQPLAGEYAGRVEMLRAIPFFCGYAVEIGLLVDLLDSAGLDALAQVDLGERVHRNRATVDLGPMAFEIMQAVLTRVEAEGRAKFDAELPDDFLNFILTDGKARMTSRQIPLHERPPMATYSGSGAVASGDDGRREEGPDAGA